MTTGRLKGAAEELQTKWNTDERWANIERTYTAEDVIKLRGSVQEEFTSPRSAPSACGTCCTPRTTSTPWAR